MRSCASKVNQARGPSSPSRSRKENLLPHLDVFITDLALITAVAALTSLIFKKLRLPVVLGYIIAGFLISPNIVWLPTVVETANIQTWANIGVVFLMFALGLEFGFRRLADIGVAAVITALTVMIGMMALGYLVGDLMGWDRLDSIFLGGILSISSTMIIKKVSDDYQLGHSGFHRLVMGTLVVEDIFAVFLMILLTALSVTSRSGGAELIGNLGILLLFLVFWLAAGVYLIPSLLKKTQRFLNDESLLILTLAICFGMVVVFSYMGFSAALGAFAAGSILAGTVISSKIEKIITPLKDLFGAVFFVSVGMLVSPDTFRDHFGTIMLLVGVTILGQMTFTFLGILFSGHPLRTAASGSFCMVQIGEFSFIIAAMGQQLQVTRDTLFPIVVSVAIITILTTPLFIANAGRAAEVAEKYLPRKFQAMIRRYSGTRSPSARMDEDWKRFMSVYFARVFICTSGLILIYFGALKWFRPLLSGLAGDSENILVAFVATVAMIPVISVLWSRRGALYPKLWLKSKSNHVPLIALHGLRILISLFFLVLVFYTFLDLPKWLLLALAGLILVVVIRSDFLKGQTIRIEARFISNFNEKLLHHMMEERKVSGDEYWLGNRVSVVEFMVAETGRYKNVKDLYDNRMLNLLIIKIIRGEKHILMPEWGEPLESGDIVHMIGSLDHLEAYLYHLQKDEHLILSEEHRSTMKEYTYGQVFKKVKPEEQIYCSAICLPKDSPFSKKAIKSCGFRRIYQGSIIAIERGPLPIIAPKINTVLEPGDILWVIGTETMAKRLLMDGLLDH